MIICCGFTPCIQRILEFEYVEKDRVNRAQRVTLGIGGKGANTARMIQQLGARGVLLGFAGGANGQLLENMLSEQSVPFRHVAVAGETRICQTLVEQGNPETTELVEEMPPLSAEEWGQMTALLASLEMKEQVVTVSGKLPAGAPVDAYAQVAQVAYKTGGKMVLDAPGEPMLLALEHEPFLVKINDVELSLTLGEAPLLDNCKKLIDRGAGSVLITRGAKSAIYVDERQALELLPPAIDAVNPVGSGDAVTAGLAVAIAEGAEMNAALALGMACGAANALNLISGMLVAEDVERLRKQVQINSIHREDTD